MTITPRNFYTESPGVLDALVSMRVIAGTFSTIITISCVVQESVVPWHVFCFSGAEQNFKSRRILSTDRPVLNVYVVVDRRLESQGIFRDESAKSRIVVSGAVIIESGFGIELSSRVTEGVRGAAGGGRQISEGIIR